MRKQPNLKYEQIDNNYYLFQELIAQLDDYALPTDTAEYLLEIFKIPADSDYHEYGFIVNREVVMYHMHEYFE